MVDENKWNEQQEREGYIEQWLDDSERFGEPGDDLYGFIRKKAADFRKRVKEGLDK